MNKIKEHQVSLPIGQFVAVWEHGGEVWSYTLNHNSNGELCIYDRDMDKLGVADDSVSRLIMRKIQEGCCTLFVKD